MASEFVPVSAYTAQPPSLFARQGRRPDVGGTRGRFGTPEYEEVESHATMTNTSQIINIQILQFESIHLLWPTFKPRPGGDHNATLPSALKTPDNRFESFIGERGFSLTSPGIAVYAFMSSDTPVNHKNARLFRSDLKRYGSEQSTAKATPDLQIMLNLRCHFGSSTYSPSRRRNECLTVG